MYTFRLGGGTAGPAGFGEHAAAIEHACSLNEDVLVLEADVELGRSSMPVIADLVARRARDTWDVMCTDLRVDRPQDMVNLFQLKHRYPGVVRTLEWRVPGWRGAGAYVLNAARLERLRRRLPRRALRIEFGTWLAREVRHGRIAACVAYPFPTTIRVGPDAALEHLFRRLAWIHANAAEVEGCLAPRFAAPDAARDALAELLGGLMHPATVTP